MEAPCTSALLSRQLGREWQSAKSLFGGPMNWSGFLPNFINGGQWLGEDNVFYFLRLKYNVEYEQNIGDTSKNGANQVCGPA